MKRTLLIAFCFMAITSCSKEMDQPKPYVELAHPEWTKKATIYEVNIRQFSETGDFEGFRKHLPRLKDLGVDILWLMPIHPIGEKNRKGSLGSYYAVKDYYAVNPEFGTMDDFRQLVREIHDMGMYVILDWVANHSAWDNDLVNTHLEWYSKNEDGGFQPTPWYDWSDIIDFDYAQPGVRRYMTDALKFWVEETDVDGFRCDVAGFIPIEFWEQARKELDSIKPVFMLAEWESRDLHKKAFDMTYSWSLYDAMHDVYTGHRTVSVLHEYFAHHVNTFPANAFRMLFVDNHDKNSWEGSSFEVFGEALDAFIALTVVADGMPLIYSGQEAGLDRKLAFFDADPIAWQDHPTGELYKKLFQLKHDNPALWNGKWGGETIEIKTDNPEQVLAFARKNEDNLVIYVANFSGKKADFKLRSSLINSNLKHWDKITYPSVSLHKRLKLEPWEYLIFVNENS